MESLPLWVKAAIGSRVEELGVLIRRDPRLRASRQEVTEQFEQLSRSFSEAQHDRYSCWEEKLGFLGAMEKEQLYLHGFMDGYRVHFGLNQLSRERSSSMIFDDGASDSDEV